MPIVIPKPLRTRKAVRFDANADFLSRTANLPTGTAFTACGWASALVDTNDVAALFTLNESGDNWFIGFGTDGTTLELYGRNGASATTFASSPPLGVPFAWAITASGTTVTGYWRPYNSGAWQTVTVTASAAGTTTSVRVGNDPFAARSLNGAIWNVKVWNRALSAAELSAETNSERVLAPASLNFHWPLADHLDRRDLSGQRRVPTPNGTLTSYEVPRALLSSERRGFWMLPAGGVNGTVANATTATTLSTVAGTQTHVGTVASATSATASSTPAGTQTYVGAVAGATSGTTLSTPAGTVASTGTVDGSTTATSTSSPTGTQTHQGAVANATTATTLSTPAGTFGPPALDGAVADSTTATTLSDVAGVYVPPQEQPAAAGPQFPPGGASATRSPDITDDELLDLALLLISTGALECRP